MVFIFIFIYTIFKEEYTISCIDYLVALVWTILIFLCRQLHLLFSGSREILNEETDVIDCIKVF